MVQVEARRVSLKSLVLKTLLITPSGALSPGPLSLSALAAGIQLGLLGGLLVATGHVIVELPYILLLVKGVSRIRNFLARAEKPLTSMMMAFIVYFAYLLIRDAFRLMGSSYTPPLTISGYTEALLYGVVFTGANVYFLLWWVSVGLPLVRGAAELGAKGITIMYASHVWMDYAWLGALALVASSISRLGGPLYAGFLLVLAAILLLFGVDMMLAAFKQKRILPF